VTPRRGSPLLYERPASINAANEVRTLHRYARRADDILAGSSSEETSHEAEQLLGFVEEGLLRLARSTSVGDSEARQVLALRDELSGRLLAAVALDAIEMPVGTIGDVLRKATAATTAGLTAISQTLGVLVTQE
jgi:hypothetical protein